MRKLSGIGVMIFLALSGWAAAQRPGEAELGLCLSRLLGPGRGLNTFRRVQVKTGSPEKTFFKLDAEGANIVELDCDRFKVRRGGPGQAHRIARKVDGIPGKEQGLKKRELDSLNRYLALDPAWAVSHVLAGLEHYEITVESNGEMVFTWTERVLLSAPSEKEYGLYGERLVIDPATGRVAEFGILALSPDGRPVMDVLADYAEGADGKTWAVMQLAHTDVSRVANYTVRY